MLTNALGLMLLCVSTSCLALASDSGLEVSLSAPEAGPMHGRSGPIALEIDIANPTAHDLAIAWRYPHVGGVGFSRGDTGPATAPGRCRSAW